jgi:hypothetical protein
VAAAVDHAATTAACTAAADAAPLVAGAAAEVAADAGRSRDRRKPHQAPKDEEVGDGFLTIAEIKRQALAAANRAIDRDGSPISARHAREVAVYLQRQLAARRLVQSAKARRAAADAAANAATAHSAI